MTNPDQKIIAFDANQKAYGTDAIAELYAELVAAWPRVEEKRKILPASDVTSARRIRLGTYAR